MKHRNHYSDIRVTTFNIYKKQLLNYTKLSAQKMSVQHPFPPLALFSARLELQQGGKERTSAKTNRQFSSTLCSGIMVETFCYVNKKWHKGNPSWFPNSQTVLKNIR